MKYYIIAGEASGDLHGSNLIKALKEKQPQASFRAWGGDRMEAAGAEVVKHYRDLAFMGFVEVLLNIRTILKNISYCKQDIMAYQPDAVILIDYPGFNLRMAEFVKKAGIKVFYYISPQIWAWKQNRVHKIKQFVDHMFVILPFEKEFYQRFQVDVDFVGHPLLDAIQNEKAKSNHQSFLTENGLDERPIIALLPGSRKQEISNMLPIMAKMEKAYPAYQLVIAGAPSQESSFYQSILPSSSSIKIVKGKTYDLLQQSYAALVTSGTATLETALFKVPQVVCYKGSTISYHIARQLVKVKYISLVNLIMDEEVVRELIQGDLNEKLLKTELGKLLEKGSHRESLLHKFDALIEKLGGSGASEKTAFLIDKYLSEQKD